MPHISLNNPNSITFSKLGFLRKCGITVYKRENNKAYCEISLSDHTEPFVSLEFNSLEEASAFRNMVFTAVDNHDNVMISIKQPEPVVTCAEPTPEEAKALAEPMQKARHDMHIEPF